MLSLPGLAADYCLSAGCRLGPGRAALSNRLQKNARGDIVDAGMYGALQLLAGTALHAQPARNTGSPLGRL